MNKIFLLLMVGLCSIAACSSENKDRNANKRLTFKRLDAGTLVNKGDSVNLDLNLPDGFSFDSVHYGIDGKSYRTLVDRTASIWFNTADVRLGSRQISATIFTGGESETVNSNVVVVAAKPPKQYSFRVVNTYPHDDQAYTQGLEYRDGYLYESTGQRGSSSLRKVALKSGEVVQQHDLPAQYFGEGLTLVDDKIIQLTWQEGVGFVYDRKSFALLKEFPYQESKEGWGLCYDGTRLIKSDGSNRLYFLNKETYREEGYIEVYNHKGKVDNLNELEFIDGKIYANVYYADVIVVIDPETGEVEGELNLIGLLPQQEVKENTNVLNGIAYDHKGKRLFVTGKNWDSLFEIEMLERN